ncbi:hypothetical protein PCE1_004424 [Barthelona sp. PCE]
MEAVEGETKLPAEFELVKKLLADAGVKRVHPNVIPMLVEARYAYLNKILEVSWNFHTFRRHTLKQANAIQLGTSDIQIVGALLQRFRNRRVNLFSQAVQQQAIPDLTNKFGDAKLQLAEQQLPVGRHLLTFNDFEISTSVATSTKEEDIIQEQTESMPVPQMQQGLPQLQQQSMTSTNVHGLPSFGLR